MKGEVTRDQEVANALSQDCVLNVRKENTGQTNAGQLRH